VNTSFVFTNLFLYFFLFLLFFFVDNTHSPLCSYIHKIGTESLPYACILIKVKATKFIFFPPCTIYKIPLILTKETAIFKNLTDSYDKTCTDLVATVYSIYFNNLSKIICEFLFFYLSF